MSILGHVVDDSELSKFHDWIADKGQAQLTDSFHVGLRELACEMMLPLGARMQTQRNPDTKHQVTSGQQLLLSEIGQNIVEQINIAFLNLKIPEVASDPLHRYYNIFALNFVEYYFQQHMQIPFLHQFFVFSTRFMLKSERDKFTMTSKDLGWCVVPACPRISFVCGLWIVHHQQKLYECATFSHAIVQWIRLVHDHHESMLEDDHDISAFCAQFLAHR